MAPKKKPKGHRKTVSLLRKLAKVPKAEVPKPKPAKRKARKKKK